MVNCKTLICQIFFFHELKLLQQIIDVKYQLSIEHTSHMKYIIQ